MNHNPHNLRPGDLVTLDSSFNNTSRVVIQQFTPNKLFARVYSPENENEIWSVMTYRLTPINHESKETKRKT